MQFFPAIVNDSLDLLGEPPWLENSGSTGMGARSETGLLPKLYLTETRMASKDQKNLLIKVYLETITDLERFE
jgi:hypothetical protein